MKAVALSAAAIALVGVTVSAQETGQESLESPTDAQLAAAASSTSGQPRWIDSIGQSSLLTQLNAVMRARETAFLAEAGLPSNTVHVTPRMNDEIVAREEVCRRMPEPGSRIQTERCFTETESERRLNEYQFDEELRFSRQEALRKQMEDAMRAASEAAQRAAGMR